MEIVILDYSFNKKIYKLLFENLSGSIMDDTSTNRASNADNNNDNERSNEQSSTGIGAVIR